MQTEITKEGVLLDEKGLLTNPGYSKTMVQKYNRNNIKSGKLRIKEWDYYLIYNDDYAVALTVADNGYMGMLSASLIDFSAAKETTKSKITFMPKGKLNTNKSTGEKITTPETSLDGDIYVKTKAQEFEFRVDGDKRYLNVTFKNFKDKKDLVVAFELFDTPEESMCVATPFDKKPAFYYNQKIVGMKAKGYAKLGDLNIDFSDKNTQAILDWGRGVWTYKNTWYWGAGCGLVKGKKFGFNIGYGFGDTSAASENMLFYEGKAHKLEDVTFNIPKTELGTDDFLSPWTFSSSDGRFEMKFVPIINRKSLTNIGVLCSDQNQVFGKFSGKAILDDGKVIELKDFVGFAEKVFNKW